MPFVVDSSVVMAWCFEDESSPYADQVLEMLDSDTAMTPAIWPLEIVNAVCTGERRQRLQPADSARFLDLLSSLPISIESVQLARIIGSVLDIARTYGLTSYDAAYLDLAMREGVALATQDARLRTAATSAGVPLLLQNPPAESDTSEAL